MTTRIHWNTAGMQGLADSQDGAHARFNAILGDVRSSKSKLMGLWHGEGQGEYAGKQNQHEGNYEQLQQTFRELINSTNTSIGNATTAMSRVSGIWGG